MSQADIDALINQRAAAISGEKPRPRASQTPHPARGQHQIDAMLGQAAPSHSQVARRIPQVPNALGARTLSPEDYRGNKVLRSERNGVVTGMRKYKFSLPGDVSLDETALNAIQRLFSLANAFREIHSDSRVNEVARVSNKFGHSAVIAITKNPAKPVRIRMGGILTYNAYNKFVETQQTYYVDKFVPHRDGLSRRWVDWFTFQFDTDTLETLMQLNA